MNSKIPESKLFALKAELLAAVQGQEAVVERLNAAVLRREMGTVPPRAVRGAFIFAGPTGVGKTALATRLAHSLFGNEGFFRFDCSEYKTLSAYDRLFADGPDGIGLFSRAISAATESVWLFDEIEKAHPDFAHLFLQAADAARLTLSNGRTIDLSEIYFVLTTNLGSAAILERPHLPRTTLENHVIRALEGWLRPELQGRFERPFVFEQLSRKAQAEIASRRLEKILQWHAGSGRKITVDSDVLSFLIAKGYSARLGARPLLRTIDELVGNALIRPEKWQNVVLFVEDGKLHSKITAKP